MSDGSLLAVIIGVVTLVGGVFGWIVRGRRRKTEADPTDTILRPSVDPIVEEAIDAIVTVHEEHVERVEEVAASDDPVSAATDLAKERARRRESER